MLMIGSKICVDDRASMEVVAGAEITDDRVGKNLQLGPETSCSSMLWSSLEMVFNQQQELSESRC